MTTSLQTAYRVTPRRVLRSEWAKLWSVRSTGITLAVAVALLVAFGAIASSLYSPTGSGGGGVDAVSLALTGTSLAALAFGVIGVLTTAGEYSTGMIRSTLTAVPRRLPVLWSKAAVFGLVATPLAVLGVLAAFTIGHFVLHTGLSPLSPADAGVTRSLLGAGLYLGLVGVFGVAIGALLRSVPGAIAALVTLLLIVPGLTSLLPGRWSNALIPYLPSNAGQAVFVLHRGAHTLAPWVGLAVFAGWVALSLAAAAVRLVRTDV